MWTILETDDGKFKRFAVIDGRFLSNQYQRKLSINEGRNGDYRPIIYFFNDIGEAEQKMLELNGSCKCE